MEQIIDLRQFGCIEQNPEFYERLEQQYLTMDELDKSRVLLYFTQQILNKDMKMHPVVIMQIMENLQSMEINCAKMKKMLGDIRIKALSCKQCGKCIPEMTMLMVCQGVNQKCPHDIEIEINE